MNIEHNKLQHTYTKQVLENVEQLYLLEDDEALEEVSFIYKHLAQTFLQMSNAIETELNHTEAYVFNA